MICGKEYKMKDKFLIETSMTVEEARKFVNSFKFHLKEIRKFSSLFGDSNSIDSFDSNDSVIFRLNGTEYKLSDLEFINKKNGLHFFLDEDGFAHVSTPHLCTKDTTYPEKEIGETEMNENEVAQNFVNDFEDTLSDYIDKLLGDYKEIESSIRSTVKDFCDGISKKETNEEDKSLTSDAKCNSVVHPNHYNSGKYECIEVMREVFGEEAVKLFCAMNAFKYLWRYNKKNGEEDVAKACNYLKIRSGLNKTEE